MILNSFAALDITGAAKVKAISRAGGGAAEAEGRAKFPASCKQTPAIAAGASPGSLRRRTIIITGITDAPIVLPCVSAVAFAAGITAIVASAAS
jgi:hypothetical protein